MIRCIMVDLKTGKDKETEDDLLFITLCKLPNKMRNGGIWHPKISESIVNVCINKTTRPDDYVKFASTLPGTLFDVVIATNERTGKSFVASCVMVPGSNKHSVEEVYL